MGVDDGVYIFGYVQNVIGFCFFCWYFYGCDYGVVGFLIGFDYLLKVGWFIYDYVIGQYYGYRFVLQQVMCVLDCVVQIQCFVLVYIGDGVVVYICFVQNVQQVVFVGFFQVGFQFMCVIEIIFECVFVLRGYEDEFFDFCCLCFIDGVLD